MSSNELKRKIEALQEWEAIIAEAEEEATAIREAIKAEMLAQDTEEMQVEHYKVRWTKVVSNRFDSSAFKKEHTDLYLKYVRQSESRRFFIA